MSSKRKPKLTEALIAEVARSTSRAKESLHVSLSDRIAAARTDEKKSREAYETGPYAATCEILARCHARVAEVYEDVLRDLECEEEIARKDETS